jgi:hypothetical protein
MASNENNGEKRVPVMINATVALEGSKAFFAGMDTLPKNFEQLSEKEQEKALTEADKVGQKRKAATQKKMDELESKGQQFVLTININGQLVSGAVDWNSEKTGLRARINLGRTTAKQAVAKATAKKNNNLRTFLGL